VVGLGFDVPKMEDDLVPEEINGVYLIRVLNKEKMFEYWKNIVSVHNIIDDLSKVLIKENKIFNMEEMYRITTEEIYRSREIVFNVLSGKVSKDEVFKKNDKEINSIFEKGTEILEIIKNVKEHELMTREISEELATFLEKSEVKQIGEVVDFLEVICKKQNERKESFTRSIPLNLQLELSKNELNELKNDKELKNGETKMMIIQKLSELENQIEETAKRRDNRKFLERKLKKEDDKKIIELNEKKKELEKSISFDQTGNILTENERKKIIRKNQLVKKIIPELEKQKKYFKY
jgi:hypothetical protein